MDSLTLLTTRRSYKKLDFPVPNAAQLERLFQAALHAPDHGRLQPYRFTVIEKEKLPSFADLLKQAAVELNLGDERLKKADGLAQRAPMLIAVVAKIDKSIAKVPAWEQMLTAGAATYALQLAANAQGFDNVWLSGPWLEGTAVRQALGCREQDKIIALVMIGTAQDKAERENREKSADGIVTYF